MAYSVVNDIILLDGVTHISDKTYSIPVSILFDHFDSSDDNEASLDDDLPILTLRQVVDNIRGDERYQAIAPSIASEGIVEPLSASPTCRLLNGHHRLAAAVDAGLTSVPVRFTWVPQEVAA